jgi:hypothetical protein
MGLLARGMSMLGRIGAENESETITYSRPFVFSAKSMAAVIGGPGFDQEDNTDVPGRVAQWEVDFIIRVEDFETACGATEPKDGDHILRTITRRGASRVHRFRVFAGNVAPAWDWGEPERITYRIHARYEQ